MDCVFESISAPQKRSWNIYDIEKQQKEQIENQSDLEIAGFSPFVFRRFYDSRNERSGCLGRGWFHNYELSLTGPISQKTLILENGKEVVFRKLSNGNYMSLCRGGGVLLGNDEGFIYYQPDGCCYYFNPEGRYERQVDADGNELCLQYEEKNARILLDKVIRSTGEGFAFIYDDAGYLRQVMDHSGRMVSYVVQIDLLKQVVRPAGASFSYEYTPEGKLTRVINTEDITVVENIYDDRSRIIKQCFPNGESIGYAYDDEKNQVMVTERSGKQTIHVYDKNSRLIVKRDSEGEIKYTYNSLGLKTSVTDRSGNMTKMDYDAKGNLICVTNALGVKTQIYYNALNKPAYVVVDGVCKIRNCYDDNGNLAECRNALNHRLRFSYNKQGLPIEIRQADKSRVYIAYDRRGNILFIRDAVGIEYHYVYNSRNQVVETIDGSGNSFCYTYDAEGHITKIVNPNGNIRTYTYNSNGKVTEINDFDGASIRWEYDVMNQPVKVTDKEGKVTRMQYNAMGNLCRVTGSEGVTTFIYNKYNRLVWIKSAEGDVISFTYDAVGNPIQMKINKTKTSFAYDALGRLIRVKEANGDEIDYLYNADDRVIKVSDNKGYTVQMDYNVASQLIREQDSLGNSFSYTYHPSGEVETVTDTKGDITRYRYGSGGRLKGIIYPDKSVECYVYNPNGNLKAHVDTKGFQRTYTYDKLNQITKIKNNKGESKTYAYDVAGNLIECTFNVSNRMVKVQRYGELLKDTGDQDGDFEIVQRHNEKRLPCNNIVYQRELLKLLEVVTGIPGEKKFNADDPVGQLIHKIDKTGYLKQCGNLPFSEISHIRFSNAEEAVFTCAPLRQLTQLENWLGIFRKGFGRRE